MGDTFRGFGEMLVKVAIFIAVMIVVGSGAIYMITYWIDGEFGDGTATPLILIMAGVGAALLLFVVVTFLNNMTHRAAGDDVVAIFDGVSKTLTERERATAAVQRERERARQIAMKDQADERRVQRGLQAWLMKRQEKYEDQKRRTEDQRRAAKEAEEAEWKWFDDQDVDLDMDLEVID